LSRLAMPSPMPRLDPVTRATWPSNRRPDCGAVAVLSDMCELQCSVGGRMRSCVKRALVPHSAHIVSTATGADKETIRTMNQPEHHLVLGSAHLFQLARAAVLTWARQESAGVSVRHARRVRRGQVVDLRLNPLWPTSPSRLRGRDLT